jgi:tetratricopeptide (TPR) repeat protein
MNSSARAVLARLGLTSTAIACLLASGCQQRSLLAVRESGDRHYARAEYPDAEKDYLEYLQRAPGRPEVHQMLGNTYIAMGNPGLGKEHLLIANSLRLEDDTIFQDTCKGLYADKQYDELNRLLRARTVDRGRMQDYLLLAHYAMLQGDKDETQQALLTAARVDNGLSVTPQLELAKLYASVGDNQRAVERVRMAYYCDPQNGEVIDLARKLGQIPGPALGLVPTERPVELIAPK